MERPLLDIHISLEDFKEFYWLKEELVAFGRSLGMDTSGSKIEIATRIIYWLETGELTKKSNLQSKAQKMGFQWSTETLLPTTVLTDTYKNTENVRQFFVTHIGKEFSFNVLFMRWMKENAGKTLADAIVEWKRIKAQKKDKTHQTEIAPQFEYNRYMRAFLADNPDKSSKDAMRFWKLKRAKRGTNEYERSDLDLS